MGGCNNLYHLNIIYLTVCLICSTISAQFVEENKLSDTECIEAGFNSTLLKCHICNLLPKFNLEEIMTDCLRCCIQDIKQEHERYQYAEIEVCTCNLNRFPQISAFVRGNMKDQWGNRLKVRHVRGVLPTITLKNIEGQTVKSLNIEKWDTDTVTEFLNDWLEI